MMWFWNWTGRNWENFLGSNFSGDCSQTWTGQTYYFNASKLLKPVKVLAFTRDLKEKVDPYLRPVYDALYQILGKEQTTRLMERDIIEIAPAYMRGRTLDDAFVILDEAQNTTIMQMKMFLTRLGFNSKMIVNGDTSQIDLPKKLNLG